MAEDKKIINVATNLSMVERGQPMLMLWALERLSKEYDCIRRIKDIRDIDKLTALKKELRTLVNTIETLEERRDYVEANS